jgi:hypothetical protein
MGQQPNIELDISDLPRPVAAPAPARRWKPERPGDPGAPADTPWGGAFGTPGPDTGYALRLVRNRELDIREGESRRDLEAALTALIAARASLVGRAPTSHDVDVAMLLLGLDSGGIPAAVTEALAADRAGWITGAAHHPVKAGAIVAAVDPQVLLADPATVRSRMAAGDRLIDR